MMETFLAVLQPLWIPAAFALDAVVGDPHGWPHPVRWMGRAISAAEPIFRNRFQSEVMAGAFFTSILVVGCWAVSAAACAMAEGINPVLGTLVEVVMLA